MKMHIKTNCIIRNHRALLLSFPLMTIIDDYFAYDAKYKSLYDKVIVLMEVGSFWEMYDAHESAENARAICDLLDITLTQRNKLVSQISAHNPFITGFPTSALDKYLSILKDAHYTVVLVSYVSGSPNPERQVTRVLEGNQLIPN